MIENKLSELNMPYEQDFFEKTYRQVLEQTMKRFENYSKKFLSFNQMLKIKAQFKIHQLKDYQQR